MGSVVTFPTPQTAPAPLHGAIEDLVAATGRVLRSQQEHAGSLPDELHTVLELLRRAYAAYQAARELSAELTTETGRPTLHIVGTAMALPRPAS